MNTVVFANIEENQMLTIDNNNVPENNAINFNEDTIAEPNNQVIDDFNPVRVIFQKNYN